MKRLTKEEAANIRRKPHGRASYARGVLLGMQMGEIILLEPKDWTRKSQKPSTYCLQLGRKTGRKWNCSEAMDGSGWVIERVK